MGRNWNLHIGPISLICFTIIVVAAMDLAKSIIVKK
jgi:hypothetical protein